MNRAEFRTQRSGSTIELLCRGERVISAFGILTVGQERKNNENTGICRTSGLQTRIQPCGVYCRVRSSRNTGFFGCEVRVLYEQYCSCLHTGFSVPVYPGSGACCFLQILYEQGFTSTLQNWDYVGSSDTNMFALKFAITL